MPSFRRSSLSILLLVLLTASPVQGENTAQTTSSDEISAHAYSICREELKAKGCDLNSKDPDLRDCSKDPKPISDTATGLARCGINVFKDMGTAVRTGFGFTDSPEYRLAIYNARKTVFLKMCQHDSGCLTPLYKAAYGKEPSDKDLSYYSRGYYPRMDDLWNRAAMKHGWRRPGSDPWFVHVSQHLGEGLEVPQFDVVAAIKKEYNRFFCLSTSAQVEMICGVSLYALGGTAGAFKALGLSTRLSRLASLARMTAQGSRLEVISMQAQYIGEELKGIEGPVYLTEAQRATRRLSVKNGLIYDANGKLWNANEALYVMDKDGNLFGSAEYRGRSMAGGQMFHHSSFFAGKDVSGAGTITVKNGKLIKITRDSGHYKPKRRILDQVVNELGRQGVDVSNVEVDYTITQP